MDAGKVRQQIKEQRDKIKKLATAVTMSYEGGDEEIMIGEEWVKQAKGVHSIVCSLNGDDCTVLNVIFSEGGELKPHHHDRQEFVFVASGSITETVSGKIIKEGHSVIIESKQSHGWRSNGAKLTVVWKPPYPTL